MKKRSCKVKKDEELKTLKKIQRVKTMSEQNKKMYEIQQHIEHLQGVVKTGKATKDMYDKMCDVESIIKGSVREKYPL